MSPTGWEGTVKESTRFHSLTSWQRSLTLTLHFKASKAGCGGFAVSLMWSSQAACTPSRFIHVRLFATPWAAARQAPLSRGFSRQEHGVGYHPLLQGMKKERLGNSLVVQWLGLSTCTVTGMGSILGQGTNISEAIRRDQKKKKTQKRKEDLSCDHDKLRMGLWSPGCGGGTVLEGRA